MKKAAILLALSCGAIVALALSMRTAQIPHYTADALAGLTCDALGERHEEVIVAYHDADLRHFRQTGAFLGPAGLPREDDLPFVVLIRRFIADNGIAEADILHPLHPDTGIQRGVFYPPVSAACAANGNRPAVEVMRQVALDLDLIGEADAN